MPDTSSKHVLVDFDSYMGVLRRFRKPVYY